VTGAGRITDDKEPDFEIHCEAYMIGAYDFDSVMHYGQCALSDCGDYELLGGFWPGGPLCFVNFEHFARFAEHWLDTLCDAGNNFCAGADLHVDENNIVNRLDLKAFTEQWLCYCPTDWPLK
jgi:hypothetical protein